MDIIPDNPSWRDFASLHTVNPRLVESSTLRVLCVPQATVQLELLLFPE